VELARRLTAADVGVALRERAALQERVRRFFDTYDVIALPTVQVVPFPVELDLSAKEFALLELFMRRAGETLSRVQLLDGAWDMAFESRSNVVDVYVRYLREKIDRPFGRRSIETVRGVGYRLRADGG